jgi:Flp pilus assembly pilin Flp
VARALADLSMTTTAARAANGSIFERRHTVVSARRYWVRDQAGQTMAEYAVNLTIITVAIVVAISLLSSAISAQLTSVVGIL